MTKDDLCAEEGVKKLLGHMDKKLKKDDFGRLWSRFVIFDEVRKRENQSVADYISDFEIALNKLELEGVKLPKSVLAMLLIRRAGLSPDTVKLCKTGLSYDSTTEDLYEQAIKSLNRFAEDDESLSVGVSSSSTVATGGDIQIKQEVNAVSGYRPGFRPCLLYTSPSPRDGLLSRMPSSA